MPGMLLQTCNTTFDPQSDFATFLTLVHGYQNGDSVNLSNIVKSAQLLRDVSVPILFGYSTGSEVWWTQLHLLFVSNLFSDQNKDNLFKNLLPQIIQKLIKRKMRNMCSNFELRNTFSSQAFLTHILNEER